MIDIIWKIISILIFLNLFSKCLNETEINKLNEFNNVSNILNENRNQNSIITASANKTQKKREIATCPLYKAREEKTKNDLTSFLKDTYDSAVDLCNTSSRVGCQYSDFLRLISTCINDNYFDVDDVIEELRGNKELNELPQVDGQPVFGHVSFKIVNIDAVSVKDMDFKIDFYLAVVWDINFNNTFFRKYMTRICVAKKHDMEKKLRLLLYQEDMKLFWVPDLYFPNAKFKADHEKRHLKRPISRDLLHISFKIDNNYNPLLRFVFVTSGHSNILCPMKFEDYPSDVQECIVKIRSFYYYQDELRLVWSLLTSDTLQLLEYSITVSKYIDQEEDHFIVQAGDAGLNKKFKNFFHYSLLHLFLLILNLENFTRLNIRFNFTRNLTNKVVGVYIPSLMLITLNYLTYYFGVNSYSSRSCIGIMVLLTLTIMFSKERSELPGSSNISGMEVWLICCFICDLIQLIESSIVESIYTNHCIDFYLRKKSKRELETEYLGYSYSMLFDDTSDEDDAEENYHEKYDDDKNQNFLTRLLIYFGNLILHLILPNFSRKRPEYWSIVVDKIFRIFVPIFFGIFCSYYWGILLKD